MTNLPARISRALLLGLLPAAAAAAQPQTPTLLRDLESRLSAVDSLPSGFLGGGQPILFSAWRADVGRELWSTDGTPGGTQLHTDLEPGSASSSPGAFYRLGNSTMFTARVNGASRLYHSLAPGNFVQIATIEVTRWFGPAGSNGTRILFVGDDGVRGKELWAMDRVTNQVWLVKDIVPGASGSYIYDILPVPQHGVVYFSNYTSALGNELWRTDGTTAGTSLLIDLNPGSGRGRPTSGGDDNIVYDPGSGRILFAGNDGASGLELWSSDGTAAGTRLEADLQPGSAWSDPARFVVDANGVGGNDVFFAADNASGQQDRALWGWDGRRATQIAAFASPIRDITRLANQSLLVLTDEPYHVTPLQTRIVKDIRPGAEGSYPRIVADMGFSRFLLRADDGTHGSELWMTDGSSTGTRLVTDLAPGADSGIDSQSDVLRLSSSTCIVAADAGGMIGDEPFVVDVDTGVATVLDIQPPVGIGSDASFFADAGTFSYFVATEAPTGRELYRTDGTAAGTGLVADINPGPASSGPSSLFVTASGRAFFWADDGTHGDELWTSDGTQVGTRLVRDIESGSGSGFTITSFCEYDGFVLFEARTTAHGNELWRTDGTTAGTWMIRDINPGPSSSAPDSLVHCGDHVYFSAYDGSNGNELWRTDGTAAGTQLVGNLRPGSSGSNPTLITSFRNRAYFFADDGVSGRELWACTGIGLGNFTLVKDIAPGSANGIAGSLVLRTNGNSLFFLANDGSTGSEPWVSNGFSGGTRLLADLRPGVDSSNMSRLTVTGPDRVAFVADDGVHGKELYTATAAGVDPVLDLVPGPTGSDPALLWWSSHQLFFSVTTAATGEEPWLADGPDLQNPRLLADIDPGPGSGRTVGSYSSCGGHVVFPASLPETGREPWIVDGRGISVPLGHGSARDLRQPTLGAMGTQVGGTLSLWSFDSAGTVATLMIGPGIPPLPIPAFGDLCYFYVLPDLVFSVGQSGSYRINIRVPNRPDLIGGVLRIQSIHGVTDSPSGFDFTNAVEVRIGQ